jgi:hypothetical protein
MDGATVARALSRMEELLNSVILEEVRSLANLAENNSHSAQVATFAPKTSGRLIH